MPRPRQPKLRPGKIYRTRDLARWGTNPSRLAQRLVREGSLQALAQGLFVRPRIGRFGPVPPHPDEIVGGFLDGSAFVVSGPERWNTLGIGATAVFPLRLVYNQKRSGKFVLGGYVFLLRRVNFPRRPRPEWFVVDLIEHHEMAGVGLGRLEEGLLSALRARHFQSGALLEMARRYGSRRTRALVARSVARAAEAA